MHISTFLITAIGLALNGLIAADFRILHYEKAVGDSKNRLVGNRIVESEPTCGVIENAPHYFDEDDLSGDKLGVRHSSDEIEIHTRELGHYSKYYGIIELDLCGVNYAYFFIVTAWYADRNDALVDTRDNKVGSCKPISSLEKPYDCYMSAVHYWGHSYLLCTTPLTPQHDTTSWGH